MIVLTENGKAVVLANWKKAEAFIQERIDELPYKVRLMVNRLRRQNPIVAKRAIQAFDRGFALERIPEIASA